MKPSLFTQLIEVTWLFPRNSIVPKNRIPYFTKSIADYSNLQTVSTFWRKHWRCDPQKLITDKLWTESKSRRLFTAKSRTFLMKDRLREELTCETRRYETGSDKISLSPTCPYTRWMRRLGGLRSTWWKRVTFRRIQRRHGSIRRSCFRFWTLVTMSKLCTRLSRSHTARLSIKGSLMKDSLRVGRNRRTLKIRRGG